MLRRQFLINATALAAAGLATGKEPLTPKERVDAVLSGQQVDRPPFSFWHHFGLKTPEEHATRPLEFHRSYRTDIVKVMSDFPYPKGTGEWYALKTNENPFPQQIRALELVGEGLRGSNYFIETVFNSWNVAEKLSSREALLHLKESNPDALLQALNVITESQIHHARRAFKAGASGILYSVANANSKEMSAADYDQFSYPFDRRFLAAIGEGKLNILHLHVEPEYLDQFESVPSPIINYSIVVSKIPVEQVRARYPSRVIAGGIDEVNYPKLTTDELRSQWRSAASAAGNRFILTPGCSVPNDTAPAGLLRLPTVLHA